MLLADYAVVSDGKLTIVGGGGSQTGPQPAAFGIGLLIQVPWDLANTPHAFTVELLDTDGGPVILEVAEEEDSQPVAFGGEFEGGRPPRPQAGHTARLPRGDELDAPAPRARPLRVAPDDRRSVERGLDAPVQRARRGELAPGRFLPTAHVRSRRVPTADPHRSPRARHRPP